MKNELKKLNIRVHLLFPQKTIEFMYIYVYFLLNERFQLSLLWHPDIKMVQIKF